MLFVNALDDLYCVAKNDIQNQEENNLKLSSIKQGQAFNIVSQTVLLLDQLKAISKSNTAQETHQTLQKQEFENYKKACHLSRFVAIARSVGAICITGICCVVGGTLGMVFGCAVGSVAGPGGSVAMGVAAIPKGVALGAGVGTAIVTSMGLGLSFRISSSIFHPGKNMQAAQKPLMQGKNTI